MKAKFNTIDVEATTSIQPPDADLQKQENDVINSLSSHEFSRINIATE